jgi:hypothetical protein
MVKVVVDNAKGLVQYSGDAAPEFKNGVNVSGGRIVKKLLKSDRDVQAHAITAEDIEKGILTQTTLTGASTATFPIAATVLAGYNSNQLLKRTGDVVEMIYHNDGNQTSTIGVTDGTVVLFGTDLTVATLEHCVLRIRRAGDDLIHVYVSQPA